MAIKKSTRNELKSVNDYWFQSYFSYLGFAFLFVNKSELDKDELHTQSIF